MKITAPAFFASILLLAPLMVQAGPVLITGTPSDAYHLPAIRTPSPNLGGVLINFDGLPAGVVCQTFPPDSSCTNESGYTQGGVSITSLDGLYVIPDSTQSAPNELFDNSANGTANLIISYAPGTTAIGVGIADSDADANGNPVTIVLQALNSSNGDLGPAFNVTLPESDPNAGNGYFVVEDSTPDIYGLQITQSVGSADYSGLAIDDVQVAPEPSTLLLLTAGIALFGAFRTRRRA